MIFTKKNILRWGNFKLFRKNKTLGNDKNRSYEYNNINLVWEKTFVYESL